LLYCSRRPIQALLSAVAQLKRDLPLHAQLAVEVLYEPLRPLVDVIPGRRITGRSRDLRARARRRQRRRARAHRPRERERGAGVVVVVGAVEQAGPGGEGQRARRHRRRSLEGGDSDPFGGVEGEQEAYLVNRPSEAAQKWSRLLGRHDCGWW
ncbi:unnamed protein product, partial [Musa acuminata subsp. malaccensis]